MSFLSERRAAPPISSKELAEQMAAVIPPKWLDVDTDNFTAKMIMLPERADVDFPFEEQLIIELYSK